MKKAYAQSGEQCPLCNYPLSSTPHLSRCAGAPHHEALEVSPPGAGEWEKRGVGRDAGQPEFFPLVSAAHEFKTPLVVMLGYADLLRSGHLGPVNERQRDVLAEIQEGAERLQKLIQDLLLLYALRAARDAPEPKPSEAAEVNERVREIFTYWEPAARHKSLSYQFRSAPGNPGVGIEPLKLQHIVSNLIENALKFTPAYGRVVVSVTPCFWERRRAQSEFLFNLERQANHKVENAVRIDVTDTGPGIPPGHHEDIFWDFVQLPGASSRGTGLGLAIARRLTEAHKGAIWVESEQGRGSKFSLLLAQAP